MKKKNKGFSLLEIILVLAVAAGFIIGVFTLLSKSQMNSKATQETRNILTLQSEIQRMYQGQPNYNGLSTSLMIQAKIVPDSMLANPGSTSSDILNSFGGKIIPGIVTGGFNLSLYSIPTEACAKIVPAVANTFHTIVINNATVKNTNGGINMDLANAIAQCNKQDPTILLLYSK